MYIGVSHRDFLWQVLRTAGPLHLLFFIVVIFMNSYYLLNLILAIVAMSYDQLERRAADERMAEEAAVAERERLEVRRGSLIQRHGVIRQGHRVKWSSHGVA